MNLSRVTNAMMVFATAVAVFTGGATKNDSVAQAEKTEKDCCRV
jgi:hypothetical protein